MARLGAPPSSEAAFVAALRSLVYRPLLRDRANIAKATIAAITMSHGNGIKGLEKKPNCPTYESTIRLNSITTYQRPDPTWDLPSSRQIPWPLRGLRP